MTCAKSAMSDQMTCAMSDPMTYATSELMTCAMSDPMVK